MQYKLPLALVEEQAEGEIPTEERRNDGDGDRFGEPDGADDFRWSGLRRGWPGRLGGGAWHRGFFVEGSTLRDWLLCVVAAGRRL